MNEKTRRVIVIGFLLLMVVGLSFGAVLSGFGDPSTKVKYNGITFNADPVNNIWTAKINGKTAAFSFLPQDVQTIAVEGSPFKITERKPEIDFTYEVNGTDKEYIALAQHQMSLTLEQYGVFVRKGFTTNNSYGFPIIDCASSSASVPVVYFMRSNISRIKVQDNCIIAEAQDSIDIIKAKDRLVYGILGVIE